MKRKILLPILLLSAFVLGGCDANKKSSSSETVTYGVEIKNKSELEGTWYAGDQKSLSLELTPAANPLEALGSGELTVTSSDTSVVTVTGLGLTAMKAGTATIKVAYHGVEVSASATITDGSAKSRYGAAHAGNAADPLDNEDALLVAQHPEYGGEDYYVGGTVASFYHAPGSRTDGATSWFLTPAEGKTEQFEVYKCYKEDGSYLTDDDVWVNGYAVAYGPFTSYNGQFETSSAKFVSCEGNKPAPRTTVVKTFADALTDVKALADGADTYDYYQVDAYVTKKSGDNYFLTASQGEAIVTEKDNTIELYSVTAEDAVAKLTKDAKVTITMTLKNYHGQVENLMTVTASMIEVITPGGEWAVVPEPAVATRTLAEFIAGENTKALAYNVTAEVKYWKNSTSSKDKYGNMVLTDGTNELVVYGSSATASALKWNDADAYDFKNPQDFLTNETTSALAIGDTVTMKMIRADYNSTVQGTGIITAVTPGEGGGGSATDVTDVDAVATPKSVEEILAYTAEDNTLIAKITGVAENLYNATYGNFYVSDPATGKSVIIYGGYTDATFQVQDGHYSTKTKTTAATSAIIGHTVTVYGTVSAHNEIGQLANALVVDGGAYTSAVSASISANDNTLGTFSLSSETPNYGATVTVIANASSGYHVKSVAITRAYGKTVTASGSAPTFTFAAEIGNEVLVTFEQDVTGDVTDTLNISVFGASGTSYNDYTSNGTVTGVYSAQCAAGNDSIQLRSNNSNSGVIGRCTGKTAKSITVTFHSNTLDARVLNIYGSNTSFTIGDMYGSVTKVGSIAKSGSEFTYTFEANYSYIGFRSNEGALYLSSVVIVWQ